MMSPKAHKCRMRLIVGGSKHQLPARLVGVVAALPLVLAGCTGGSGAEQALESALEQKIREADDIDRTYTDEDIEHLVEEFSLDLNPDSRYPTPAVQRAAEAELDEWLTNEADAVDQLRHLFELNLTTRMLEGYYTLPAEVGEGGELEQAFEEALNDCASEAGWPDIDLKNKSLAHAQQLEAERGLTLEKRQELRHECSKIAETYPTLMPERRDELLEIRRNHYLGIARGVFEERR